LSLLNANDIGYMITGSLASSMQGEPRTTHDIDILVNIDAEVIPAFVHTFKMPDYYLSRQAIEDAINSKNMFNLLDNSSGDKGDFWILMNEPFDRSTFARRQDENLWGMRMKFSTPEDTILQKLKWINESGGESEKQFTDALRVYEMQFELLDFEYLNSWIDVLEVREIWAKMVREAKPIL
jgi:hypothetical protein